jgi:hypothetical protein
MIFLFKIIKRYLSALLWIRICVNVDPDLHPAFYLNATQMRIWIQGVQPMRIRIGQTKKSKKLNFYQKSIFK